MNNEENTFTGVLLDERPQDEKDKDWIHEELFAQGEADPVVWEELDLNADYDDYFPYNQDGSSSCVMGGIVIPMQFFEKKDGFGDLVFSRRDGYYRRFNKPQGGMTMDDAFKIGMEGICYLDQLPSEDMGESAMDTPYVVTPAMLEVRRKHRFDGYVKIANYKNIDVLAGAIRTQPLMAFWFFQNDIGRSELFREYPQVVNSTLDVYDVNAGRHQICMIKHGLINGKKFIVVLDTAYVGTGKGKNKNIRYMSEDFIKARCYAAGYPLNKLPETPPHNYKPKVHLTQLLKVGSTGDEVAQLQSVLIYEGILKIPKPTAYFGGMTLKAVKQYQTRYYPKMGKIDGIVGMRTRDYINLNYK